MASYSEGSDSVFQHNGRRYSVDSLHNISSSKPIVDAEVRSLIWILSHTKTDPSRVEKASLDIPIVVVKTPMGDVVADGAHRLQKAVDSKHTHIKAKYITEKELAMAEQHDVLSGGHAFHAMLSDVDIKEQLAGLKKEIEVTKSPSKRDILIKQIKYLDGLDRMGKRPENAYILKAMPVIPPIARPPIQMPGNRIEYADVNQLYKEHMTVNNASKENFDFLPHSQLITERTALYDGAKAVMGLGDALTGSSRGKNLKGFLKQIAGESGPKTGFFQSKLLSKKQDFSARATIYAEPNLGFNEMAVPEEMLWTLYEYHIVRDLVKNGYDFPAAKKAVEERTGPAKASFAKLVKQIPIIANRAPTLMQSNITAHFPVPVKGKTLGMNPLHLPMYAGDFDGDAITIHTPISPEAIEEAKKKLLPESHIYDFRLGLGNSLIKPGHEAILGSMHMTEPDTHQKPREFPNEEAALAALKAGEIQVNTPIRITSV